jgi:hypothetical protein
MNRNGSMKCDMKHRDPGMKRSSGTNKYPRMKHRQHGMNFYIKYEQIPACETDAHGYETKCEV